jgi:hypothetical protein
MGELADIRKEGSLLADIKKHVMDKTLADHGRRTDIIHRFFEKLTPQDNGCVEWTETSRDAKGYGLFWISGRSVRSHRVIWYLLTGNWPLDQILHSCDNPPCCAPWHLSEGTHLDNMLDMKNKGRGRTSPGRTGSGNPAAKLTEEQIKEIRRRYREEDGILQKTLAEEYGIRQSHVSQILSGKVWRSLSDDYLS